METCPSEALFFGDLNDPKSQVSRLSRSRRAFRLMEDLGTEPKVYYLKEGEWDDGELKAIAQKHSRIFAPLTQTRWPFWVTVNFSRHHLFMVLFRIWLAI